MWLHKECNTTRYQIDYYLDKRLCTTFFFYLADQGDHILFASFQLSSQVHIVLFHSGIPQFQTRNVTEQLQLAGFGS